MILEFGELGCHRWIALSKLLDRHILCLVVSKGSVKYSVSGPLVN